MRFLFIAPIHQLKVDKVMNKGKCISEGMYISNDSDRIKDLLISERFISEIGISLLKTLKDGKTYIRIEGEFDGDPDEELYGNKYLFGALRKIQIFTSMLWNIKDNGAYVREGYLFYYSVNKFKEILEPTYFYTGELTYVNSLANGSRESVIFNDQELQTAIGLFRERALTEIFDYGYINPSEDHFYESNVGLRAYYFIQMARSHTTLPMKLLFYCSVLEAIFSIDSSEINHKIAERAAVSIGTTIEDKKNIYNVVKKAYDIRSKVIHGSTIKLKLQEKLLELTLGLDSIIRRIVQLKIYDRLPYSNPTEFNEYFLDLLLFHKEKVGEE